MLTSTSNMAFCLQATCCLVVLVFLAGSDASSSVNVKSVNVQQRKGLTIAPLNTAALVGDTIVLTCTVSPPPPAARVVWTEHISFELGSTISDNENILSHPNSARYRIINDSPGQYDLEISDLRLGDGGRYACTDTVAGPPDQTRGELQVIVLDQETNCTSTAPSDGIVVEKQNHTIECVVNFQGLFAPVMTWTGPDPFIFASSTNPPTVWSGVAFTVQRDMANKRFECTTNFTAPPSQPEGIADNAPIFETVFRAPTIFVYWGPSGTYADPIRPIYLVGDTLTCHSDAYPEPTYRWQNMRTLQEFVGQVFTFTSDLEGTNQTMRCQVQNIILGFAYTDNIFIPSLVAGPATTTVPTTTLPTTTHPPVSNCEDFTGYWVSDDPYPYADLVLEMDYSGQIGEIYGIFRNRSDTIWVEVIGTARQTDWAYIGLSAIWPLNDGVTGISGECHRCDGAEVIIGDGILRAVSESVGCGVGAAPRPFEPYQFRRVATKAQAAEIHGAFSVFKPTNISKRLGLKLK